MRLRQLAACVRGLLADPTTLTAKAFGADGYSLEQHLLFLLVDELRIANWQRSKDGSRGTNRPKRISPLAQPKGTVYGGKPSKWTDEQKRAYLDRIGPNRSDSAPERVAVTTP